jgi:transcriptional regulator with XRE-family HTH domain
MQTLREFREQKALTLADLGRQIGLSESQLSRIENGGRASPDTALALEKATGIPATAFIFGKAGKAA